MHPSFEVLSHEAPVGPELHQVVSYHRDDDGEPVNVVILCERSDFDAAQSERDGYEEAYCDSLSDDPPEYPDNPHAEMHERCAMMSDFARSEREDFHSDDGLGSDHYRD